MRTKKSFYNLLSDVFPFFVLGIFSFIRVNFIIKYYGVDANGYMQLITQIFSYLALAEAGFGTAVIYKLYKPLADKDYKKISQIVNGSKIIFKRIAKIMTLGSLICAIVIPLFVSKGDLTNSFLIIIFLLNSIHYLIEYFVVYPYTSLLQADQNQYVFNSYKNIIKILFGILELILMSYRVSLIAIVGINILFTFVYIVIVLRKVKKLYPWLDKNAKPDTSAFGMTKDVMVHKLSSLVFSKTDPIILSNFSLGYVTVYTSYSYILDFLTTIVSKLYNSIRASYCNIVASNNPTDKKYFNMFLSFSFIIACFCAVTFHVCVNPFIKIAWLGEGFALKEYVVLMFSLIMFGRIIINPIYVARDSKGLYKETKSFTIIQAVVNIALSLLLVRKYQIFGVLLATVISQYLILIPCNVKLTYEKVFPEDLKKFIHKFTFSLVNSLIIYLIDLFILSVLPIENLFNLLVFMVIVAAINFIECFTIYYFFDKDFKLLVNELLNKLRRKKK